MKLKGLSLLLLAGVLTGCASFSEDGGFGVVEQVAKEHLDKEVRWVRSESDADSVRGSILKLLASPLSMDAAVQIALLNNPGLQAAYGELGLAEADLVQAGRLRGPGISFARLSRGDEIEIERTFILDVLGLLTLPARLRIEERRFAQTKLRTAAEVLRLAAETRRAWLMAVTAQQTTAYLEQVMAAAEASADLARRMVAAGNISRLAQMREQVFYAEATAQLARARQAAVSEREHLTRLMGLWGPDIAFRLPERLPDLPREAKEQSGVEALALKQRLDIQAATRATEGVAESLGLTRATRFINVLEFGYQRNSETGRPRQTGYEVELRLPLFDWGSARITKAEAIYMQSIQRTAETAINARSEVREAYLAYRTAFDVARHYRDEIVPLRKKISEENTLRYSGMLISVFELLADAREQIASVNAYIEALRGFWLAESALQAALIGKAVPVAAFAPGSIPAAATVSTPVEH